MFLLLRKQICLSLHIPENCFLIPNTNLKTTNISGLINTLIVNTIKGFHKLLIYEQRRQPTVITLLTDH